MAKTVKTQKTAEEMGRANYGPTFDPFSYGFNTDPKFKANDEDKYVTNGKVTSSEIDLDVKGGQTVKVSLSALDDKYATKDELSGFTEDTHITAGLVDMSESAKTLTIQVGTSKKTTQEVKVDFSSLSSKDDVQSQVESGMTQVKADIEETMDDKISSAVTAEVSEKLSWGSF